MLADWKNGPHLLTYRQTEYTFGLVAGRPRPRTSPTGCPRGRCRRICDDLLEASVPDEFKDASTSLAVDWTDLESFSRPPPHGTGDCADPEASWGHRKNNLLRSEDELFYGYYLSAGIMMPEENGPGRPRARPPRHGVVLPARPGPRLRPRADRDARRQGIPLGDILADSGYAHRDAGRLGRSRCAPPARSSSRTCTRTTAAPRAPTTARSSPTATCTAPQTPRPLLELGPLARTATREQAADHDRKTAELARYKLGRLTSDDADGYHRVAVPRRHGQDPLPAPARVDDPGPGPARDPAAPRSTPRPAAPSRPSPSRRTCIAKTAQKHDYPSAAWRRSYARRTGAERGFATAKDPATNDISPRLVPPHGPGTR